MKKTIFPTCGKKVGKAGTSCLPPVEKPARNQRKSPDKRSNLRQTTFHSDKATTKNPSKRKNSKQNKEKSRFARFLPIWLNGNPSANPYQASFRKQEVSPIKQKFFIVCLSLALAVALFSGVFAVMGWESLLGEVGSAVIYPFQWLTARAADAVTGVSHYLEDIRSLQEENKALREENESLRNQLLDAEILSDENAWLYRYLSMKEEHEDYSLCAATVVASASSIGASGRYVTEITLNRGTASGVRTGMPVVSSTGLVGVVVEAGVNHCRVTTVLDTSVSVGAVTTRGGEKGLCEGDYTQVHDGMTALRYLAEEADVQAEDIVVTGGQGSVYPYGIPIGRVVSVSFNAYSRTTEAVVAPFVDFSDLSHVAVLTAYERTAVEEETRGREVEP